MRYLGGDEPCYPEVGKYETDEETGKPIEVPEEASSAGGKGPGGWKIRNRRRNRKANRSSGRGKQRRRQRQ